MWRRGEEELARLYELSPGSGACLDELQAPFTPSTNTVSLALRAWRLVSSDLESPLTLKLGLRDPEQVSIRCVFFTRDLS